MLEQAARGERPALAPPPGNPRFPHFDGLRGIAAVGVLVFHIALLTGTGLGGPYMWRLSVVLAMFFVISGFLLYRPLVAARIGAAPPIRIRDYARRRVLRIVPGYWVALIVLAIYPGLPGVFTGRWWVYFGFAQDYSAHTLKLGIPPAWSIGCEVVFYALLPLVSIAFGTVAARAGRRVWWQFELAALAVLMAASGAWLLLATPHPGLAPNTFGFATTFAWFALGMILALASALRPDPREGRLGVLARRPWVGWVLAAVAFYVMSRPLGVAGPFQLESHAQAVAIYALSGVFAVGMTLPAVFASSPRRMTGRILSWPPLAWLGLISFGIYLYHWPIAVALNGAVNNPNPTVHFVRLLAATATISVAAAALSYYLIERPTLRMKDWRLWRPTKELAIPVLEDGMEPALEEAG